MSEFTKTVIVDPNHPDPDFRTIKQGINDSVDLILQLCQVSDNTEVSAK